MKKILLIPILLLTACTPVILEGEGTTENTTSSMRVLTRSNTDISYPLALYAFNSETEKLIASSKQNAPTDEVIFNLSQGKYLIVALTGSDECDVPEEPTMTSIINLPKSNILSTPLQMGSAAVYVTQNTTVNITLYNQVAAIDLVLSDIPTDATSVSTSLSHLHENISLDGNYSGNTTTTIKLKKENEVWRAPLFYTLPGSGSKLTLSITTISPSGTQTYGYTHNETLEANTPYSIVGSFTKGFSVNGAITLAGWNEPKEINFLFGEVNVDSEGSDVEDSNDFTLGAIPEVGTLWDEHLIAAIPETTEEDVELLLLSTTEWAGVTSAFHTETADMATSIVEAYTENGIDGWKIPTRDEARLINYAIGGDKIDETSQKLNTYGIPTLSIGEDMESGSKIRYLCDDANYSFNWDDISISKCGSKRTYHLRAVKRIRVKIDSDKTK